MTTQFLHYKPSWKPHPYQERAIKMLLGQASGGLFLDPGLGKTSICLATFLILKNKGLAKRMLIVAPLRPVYKVWPDEIKKWADFEGLTYAILHGDVKEHNREADADIYIINPEGVEWLFNPNRRRPDFDVLCIDESTKFKNTTSKRFKILKPLLPTFKRRWILTGTPSPNTIEDLFGQIYILDLGRALGRYITHFRNMYFQRSGFNLFEWSPKYGAFDDIVEKISPLVLQLSAEDYLQMPEMVYRNVEVELPQAARRIYSEVEEHFISELEGGTLVAGSAAAAGIKCRQIANGAVYTQDGEYLEVHNEKLDALENLLAELEGKPVLLLYEFRHDLDRIRGRIGDVPELGSKTSAKDLERYIDLFNMGRIPVLLGHPASMGHGLNLQGGCHHVIWFGITWNLEYYDQAIARVYRQGQKSEHVFIYHLVAKGTLDEKVLKVLTAKDRDQQKLLKALG